MDFKWLNKSGIIKNGNKIEIVAPPQTDFFAEALKNVKKGSFPNRFATRLITIPKLRETLYLR